jgi:hypothetical protein
MPGRSNLMTLCRGPAHRRAAGGTQAGADAAAQQERRLCSSLAGSRPAVASRTVPSAPLARPEACHRAPTSAAHSCQRLLERRKLTAAEPGRCGGTLLIARAQEAQWPHQLPHATRPRPATSAVMSVRGPCGTGLGVASGFTGAGCVRHPREEGRFPPSRAVVAYTRPRNQVVCLRRSIAVHRGRSEIDR